MPSFRLHTIVLLFFLLIGIFFASFFIPVEHGSGLIFTYYPYKAYSTFAIPHIGVYMGDILRLYYPLWWLGMESFKNFTLPLWNPYVASGMPLWGEGHSFFLSPLNIISFIISPELSYKIILAAWFLLSGIFTYYFCRDIGLTDRGSIIASVVFMFAGTPFHHLYIMDFAAAMAFFPLVLWRTERFYRENNYRALITLGIVNGLMLLTTTTQFCLYIFISSFFYYYWSILTSEENRRLSIVLNRSFKFLLTFIIGMGLSSAEMLPLLSFASHSQRTGTSFIGENYLSPLTLLNVLFPRITNIFLQQELPFGFLGFEGILKKLLYMPGHVETRGIYYGAIPLGFIVLAALSSGNITNKKINFFLYYGIGNILFLFLLSFNIFHSLVLYILPFDTISAVRMVAITAFSLSIISGYGFDMIHSGRNIEFFRKYLLIFLSLSVFLFFTIKIPLLLFKVKIISVMSNMGRQFFPTNKEADYINIAESFYNKINAMFSATTPDIFIHFIIIIASLILLYFAARTKTILFSALLIIIVIDLFSFHFAWVKRANPEFKYPEIESIKFLKNNAGTYRILGLSEFQSRSMAELNQMVNIPESGFDKVEKQIFPSNLSIMYGLQDIRVFDSIHIGRYDKFMNLLEGKPITDTFGNADDGQIGLKNYKSKLLNLLNVKYILSTQTLDSSNLKLVFDKDIKIYENLEVLPKAFFVTDYIVEREEKEIFNILSDNEFNPLKYVILEKEPLISVIKDTNDEQSQPHSEVKIISYDMNEVKIDVKNLKKGFLVLCDSYYPGWNAYVNGKYVEVMQANYIFRSIPLSAGEHHVSFVYEPQSFKAGAIISGSTLILVIISLILIPLKRASS